MRICHRKHPDVEHYCQMRDGHPGPHRYAVHTIDYVYWDTEGYM